ncbi:delta(3,5)-Delta(2,4)-dienoyl-CoA isomerase, mitochondrial isoform X1 [Ostrinia nubilalis]|uniref:delta(3,5)-Delta(2,4)-dienoyl-CoA isomerase, mitochondrial isoform X1 n=1 Tax=Ostrinia nubilalis TaxID=29057 RepID=UPI00308236D9
MNTIKSLILNQPKNKFTAAVLRAYSSSKYSYETLAVSVPKKNVYHVELNRPDKLNTFNLAMWNEIGQCFKALHKEPECRVIVLSGQGKLFSAGIDLKSLVGYFTQANEIEDPPRRGRFLYDWMKDCQASITTLEDCIKPVLSVVHGACIGAGINLTTAADVRYCTEDAWFQVKEVEVGLAADVGVLQRLPKIVGNTSVARELCFTARKFDAKEALQIGLVGKVLPDKESALKHALQVAEDIATKSPVAVQATKLNIIYSQDKTPKEGLEHIALINMLNHQGEDFTKSAIALATKGEKPDFEDY